MVNAIPATCRSVQLVFRQPLIGHHVEAVVIGQTTVHDDQVLRRQSGRYGIERFRHDVADLCLCHHRNDVLGRKQVLHVLENDKIVLSNRRVGGEQVCRLNLVVDQCRQRQWTADIEGLEGLELKAVQFFNPNDAFLARFPLRGPPRTS